MARHTPFRYNTSSRWFLLFAIAFFFCVFAYHGPSASMLYCWLGCQSVIEQIESESGLLDQLLHEVTLALDCLSCIWFKLASVFVSFETFLSSDFCCVLVSDMVSIIILSEQVQQYKKSLELVESRGLKQMLKLFSLNELLHILKLFFLSNFAIYFVHVTFQINHLHVGLFELVLMT